MQNIRASVIICTRNRRDDIITCLESLARQSYTDFELIIVDSSDTPLNSDSFFSQTVNQFKVGYTYARSSPGLTLQRNKGITLAVSEIIYFFDDDVVLHTDYLKTMQKTFDQNPEYLGGMGAITNMQEQDTIFWRIMRTLFLLQRDYASGNFTWSGMPTHAYGTQEFKTVEVVGGCCMAFRKKALQKHTFDEKLKRYAYMEDGDISWRISRDGPLFYQPAAQLEHHNSPTARDEIVLNRAMFMRNYRYLYFKNVYPTYRLSIIAHWWSLLGLFVMALLLRDKHSLRGYTKGLCFFILASLC